MLDAKHVIRLYCQRILQCIIEGRVHDWHEKLQRQFHFAGFQCIKKINETAHATVMWLLCPAQVVHVLHAEPHLVKHVGAVQYRAITMTPLVPHVLHVQLAHVVKCHRFRP